MAKELMTRQLVLRVTEKEYWAVKTLVLKQNKKLGEYLRERVLGGKI